MLSLSSVCTCCYPLERGYAGVRPVLMCFRGAESNGQHLQAVPVCQGLDHGNNPLCLIPRPLEVACSYGTSAVANGGCVLSQGNIYEGRCWVAGSLAVAVMVPHTFQGGWGEGCHLVSVPPTGALVPRGGGVGAGSGMLHPSLESWMSVVVFTCPCNPFKRCPATWKLVQVQRNKFLWQSLSLPLIPHGAFLPWQAQASSCIPLAVVQNSLAPQPVSANPSSSPGLISKAWVSEPRPCPSI